MEETRHIGNNIRKLRLLRGMKQSAFAKEMGIAQQNISKMEKRKKIPEEQLEMAAKILGTTTETLKNFDDKVVFQTNIINENQVNNFNSVKDILEHFEDKINKKDEEIERLRSELAKRRTTKKEPIQAKLRKVNEA